MSIVPNPDTAHLLMRNSSAGSATSATERVLTETVREVSLEPIEGCCPACYIFRPSLVPVPLGFVYVCHFLYFWEARRQWLSSDMKMVCNFLPEVRRVEVYTETCTASFLRLDKHMSTGRIKQVEPPHMHKTPQEAL